MPRKPVIAIVGTGTHADKAMADAYQLGRLVAQSDWVLITGGRNTGVMKAANEGAKDADGMTIGILPNREAAVSPDVDVAVVTDTGEARNNIIVLSADVVVACGAEGAGTVSEIALALKNRKPVVLLGTMDEADEFFRSVGGERVKTADSPAAAIEIVKSLLKE
jgi:uncharacterized protein (TIGR00725 family)